MSAVSEIDAGRVGRGAGYDYELVRGSVLPQRAWAPDAETLYDEDGEIYAEIWTSGRDHFMHLPRVATFVCPEDGRRVTAAAEPHVSRTSVDEAFHGFVVPLLLYFAGCEVLHASAVRSAGGVVGFCAEADTGKSTLAYGLSTRGFPLWADDALALDVSELPRSLRLPFGPRLRPQTLSFFKASSVAPSSGSPEGETAPLAALAVIKRVVTENTVQIARLTGGLAFEEVIRHAYRLGLKTDYARRKSLIDNYMKIVASVPVFEIRFRSGFRHFPSVLDHVAEWLDAELGQVA